MKYYPLITLRFSLLNFVYEVDEAEAQLLKQ